jgi:outer membrane receptor protein involved in Fe transport
MLQHRSRPRLARPHPSLAALALAVALAVPAGAQPGPPPLSRLCGTVVDAQGWPVAGAVIDVPGLAKSATTNASGAFELHVPPGTHRVLAWRIDHERWLQRVQVSGREKRLVIVLPARTLTLPPVHVSAARQDTPELPVPGAYQITPADAASKIGSFEDVMRSVQELPGVGSTSDLHSEIYVRGAASNASAVYLDGIEVSFPYHMLGFNSIFSPGLIENVEFFPGAPPVELGGATGGVLSIRSRGARLGDNGVAMGVSYMSGHLRAAGGDASRGWALSLRRSYHDKLVGWLDAGAAHHVPSFYDAMLRARWSPNRDHLLVAGILAAGDELSLASPEAYAQEYDFLREGEKSDSFGTDNDNLRIANRLMVGSLYWRAVLDVDAYLETTVGIVPQQFQFSLLGASNERVAMDAWAASLRQTLTWQGGAHRVRFGWQLQREDAQREVFTFASILNLRESNSTLSLTTLKDRYEFVETRRRDFGALYASDTWRFWSDAMELGTGVRLQHDALTRENMLAPRVSLAWQPNPDWSVRAAWSVSHALRSRVMEVRPAADGSTLRAERATETSVGVSRRWSPRLRAGVTGYVKRLSNLVYESEPAYYANGAEGRATGVESWLSCSSPESPFALTAQYTWARVQQRDPVAWRRSLSLGPNNELLYGTTTETPYWYSPIQDQRHNLALVGCYAPGAWELGARLEVASGRPYSAIVGVVAQPEDVYLVAEGRKGNARLPEYTRLDLRLSRHFGSTARSWTVYAEVLNATGASNVFQLRYDPTYSRRYAVTMLPTLPTLGIEARF